MKDPKDLLSLTYEKTRKDYEKLVVNSFNIDDFREYNEILISAHSCSIEGNSFSVEDTRALREMGYALKLHDRSLYEAFEILDHFEALHYLESQKGKSLSEDILKKTHEILVKNTYPYKFKGIEKPGEYTTTDMAAGDTMFGDHKKNIMDLPRLLEATNKTIEIGEIHPVEISARFHQYFIYLHPFRDGNGRLGRLLSNHILTNAGHPPIIIEGKEKNNYISALKTTKKYKDPIAIVDFFYNTAIKRMKKEIAEKKNLTKNFRLGIKNKKRGPKL